MTAIQEKLWKRLVAYNPDYTGATFTFSLRLARENGWPIVYSLRAIDEYRKFMFLACCAGHPVTPSDQVDQVWHLHLLYTQEYWQVFCGQVLQQEIHHGPTRGGTEEREKYNDWYNKTLEAYQHFFEKVPPDDVWPAAQRRFAEINFRRVNMHRYMVLPRLRPKGR